MTTDLDHKDITTKWYEANLQTLRELGLYAIKTLVTLNSGAIVVMLTFLGNAGAQVRFSLQISSIKAAMYLFLAGITAAAIVVAIAYTNSMRMSPYDLQKGMKNGLALTLYVGLALASFLLFICGVLKVVSGVALT